VSGAGFVYLQTALKEVVSVIGNGTALRAGLRDRRSPGNRKPETEGHERGVPATGDR